MLHQPKTALVAHIGSICLALCLVLGLLSYSGRTYETAKKVWRPLRRATRQPRNLLRELDSGKTTVHAAYKAVVKENEKQERKRAAEAAEQQIAAAPKRTIEVQPGDWWRLGHHLLFCGDTSSDVFVERMPSVPFAFADPPYNAGVAEWDEGFEWRHDWLIEKAQVVVVTPEPIRYSDLPEQLGCLIDGRWHVGLTTV